jgi:hypothetical protein
MKRKPAIAEVGGFVVVHAALPPKVMKWAVKRAKVEGHKDLSAVLCAGIDCLRDRGKPKSPA